MPDPQTSPADDQDTDAAEIAAAYRAGFDDGWAAAKDGRPRVEDVEESRKRYGADRVGWTGRAERKSESEEAGENDIYSDEDIQTALTHFRTHRQQLERDHFNQYVTIDIATGQMAVAPTGLEAIGSYEKKYGPSKTLTMHIGTTE